MRLYLIRHGETDWNKKRLIQGRANVSLNDFGRTLAKKTGVGLFSTEFSCCYTSPLQRARETADLILEGRKVPLIEEERLMEMDFGPYEGRSCRWDNFELPKEFEDFFYRPEAYQPPMGGESFQEVKNRLQAFLDDVRKQNIGREENVLVVCHGVSLAGILNIIKKEEISKFWGTGVSKNCAVTIVEEIDGKYKILEEKKVYYDDDVKDW